MSGGGGVRDGCPPRATPFAAALVRRPAAQSAAAARSAKAQQAADVTDVVIISDEHPELATRGEAVERGEPGRVMSVKR